LWCQKTPPEEVSSRSMAKYYQKLTRILKAQKRRSTIDKNVVGEKRTSG
jgi:hypothetical protein